MNITAILWQSITITLFVLSMMLIIDFLNVFSKGLWSENIRKKPLVQVFIGALLGIIPGCLGAYTAVSLYIHNIIGKGALVAAMIATSGDEAFFMFSIIPKTAVIIHVALFVIALLAGFTVNYFSKPKKEAFPIRHFEVHEDEINQYDHALPHAGFVERLRFKLSVVLTQLKQITRLRLLLTVSLAVAIILIILNFDHFMADFGKMDTGHDAHGHQHPQWIGITFLVVLSVSLVIVLLVSEHFLNEHLLNHVVKKHFLRIFLWIFFTLLAIHFASQYIDLEHLISNNLFVVLVVAVLVGIIPESGPHLVFIMLFASGNLPLSILLASSIVQDGHGSLPLLAESQKNFVIVKAINVLAGLIVGALGIVAGF